jgi:flagellar protein FliO/FliZ
MEFFDDLSVPVKFLIAFVVALATLGVGGYLARRSSGPRGRQPRLAVINTASLDGRRRLVLVRRDNVEHLLLIGGPTDVVIEPNIDRTGAAASAPTRERETNASPPPKPPLRQTLSLEGLGLPPSEPVYVEPPPPRPVREAIPPEAMVREGVTREQIPREAMIREAMLRPPPMPIERQRLETLMENADAPHMPTPLPDAGPTLRPSFELTPHAPPVPPPFEPVFQIPSELEPKHVPAPLLQRGAQDKDSNLAEMALRLEAALRRPLKPVEPAPSLESNRPRLR